MVLAFLGSCAYTLAIALTVGFNGAGLLGIVAMAITGYLAHKKK